MKVKELIKKLSEYDDNKEVYFMKYKNRDDDIDAFDIHKVEQTTLIQDDFEYTEFVAVVLLHKIKTTRKSN
jgi:hypothetical protein